MTTATDKKEIDINGYWTIKDNPITKVGVFPYLGRQISPDLEPNKIYQVLRPKEELTAPDTLKSLEHIPIVDEHTMIGNGFTPPEKKGIEGVTGSNVKVSLPLITNDLVIYSEHFKNQIENGKKELSAGYRCTYDIEPGEYEGEHYDAIQRNIIYNHIALVDEGRMGSECRVMDSAITFDSITDLLKQTRKDIKMAKKITLDEDLKEEIKEEIKQELLNDGGEKEEITEENEKVLDEEPENKELEAGITEGDEEPDTKTEDGDEDKRKLIDEIGGILKGKVDDELIRTIMQKAEELAYNPSETGANDEDCKDEDIIEEKKEDKEEKQEGLSMDEAIKYIAMRDNLVAQIKPVIGDNAKYSSMSIPEVVKYACDKLDIKPSLNGLTGYLKAVSRQKKQRLVGIANDSAIAFNTKSAVELRYDKNNK